MDENSDRMCGILIYTASGDSEGTMGGLVRIATGRVLALYLPRCKRLVGVRPIQSPSRPAGQGTDNSNLAACHGCLLISETSCEEGNRLLDRAMLVGRPTEPEMGFFSSML